MQRIDINDPNLTLRDKPTNWGEGVQLYNEAPFTGMIYENYPNSSQILEEGEYVDGIIHGRQVEYWQNGKIKTEYWQKYDMLYKSTKRWNEEGNLIYEAEFTDEGVNLFAKKYSSQGQLTDHWVKGKKVL